MNKNEVSKESQLMKLPFVFFLIASVTQLSAQSCFDLYGLHPLDSTPSAIISGDFDEDGYSDLAVANIASNNISILLGDGTGGFSTSINYSVGTFPYSITSADFNGDDNIDVATCNENSNDVSVLFGTGSGAFGGLMSFAVGSAPYSIISADFDEDETDG